MKTTTNVLSVYAKPFVIAAIMAFTIFECKNNEDPDPRQAFNGTYEMDDFDVLLSVSSSPDDSLFTLKTNPDIEFGMDDKLNEDEMELDLEEFVTEVMEETLGSLASATFSIDYDDLPVVEISGSEFSLDDFEFDAIVSNGSTTNVYPCEITGEGELDGDEVSFEFVLKIYPLPSDYYQWEGTAIGKRD